MTRRARTGAVALPVLVFALALALGLAVGGASARAETAAWHLATVLPPQQTGESTQEHEARTPIPLGKIGDIEFFAPNRGLLITEGVSKSIPAGIWTYNGREWRELATVCGATDGRIAWSGPDEFWTVSDGRPGQASNEREAPLADNTLCHFANGQVAGSYASLAFRADSYRAMHGAACIGPNDCWFGGEKLSECEAEAKGQPDAFQLHWNGSAVSEEPYPAEHAIEDLRRFGRFLYESVRLSHCDQLAPGESLSAPPDLHLITPIGTQPTFISLTPGMPKYGTGVRPYALDFPHLSSDEEALWGAANPVFNPPESAPSEVTVMRYDGGQWTQVIGAGTDPAAGNPFTQPGRPEAANETVSSIAAEPGGGDAWVALTSRENGLLALEHHGAAPTMLARLAPDGEVSERQALPAAGEAVGLKGPADKIVCPAANDCWLTTTQGWLYHYSDAATSQLPENGDPAFAGLITFRPPDAGIPPVVPDAPPADTSGLLGEVPVTSSAPTEAPGTQSELRVPLPLISQLHARLLHGTTLELRFHLAAEARVRLLAHRKKKLVASTPTRTFAAGTRSLRVRLNVKQWPTKIDLQTHALAPLPTTSTRAPTTTSVSTSFAVLPKALAFARASRLP
jgi:hypothetical protein